MSLEVLRGWKGITTAAKLRILRRVEFHDPFLDLVSCIG